MDDSGCSDESKKEHRVALSDAAIAILTDMEPSRAKPDGFVFPGGNKGSPLSDVAVSKALASVVDAVTVHGCRSSFRDWCAEATEFPREIAESALAHANRDKVEAAYARGDHLEKRRAMMTAWAAHCAGAKPADSGNVIEFHAKVQA